MANNDQKVSSVPGVEIERKFLLESLEPQIVKEIFKTTKIEQAFLSENIGRVVRVRIEDDKGFLTVKGKAEGLTRPETEVDLKLDDAKALLALCDKKIVKDRHYLMNGGIEWTIDVFGGHLKGLILAEVELTHENQTISLISGANKEVSHDHRFSNVSLLRCTDIFALLKEAGVGDVSLGLVRPKA